jgi:hypothetical protein
VRRPLLSLVVVGVLLLAACGGGDTDPAEVDDPEGVDATDDAAGDDGSSLLTGEPLDADQAQRPLLIAKIENSPQSRPQDGLDVADVVYEELVEGGVTRFVAIFHSELSEVAGPIRSARPVDTQLLSGYGPSAFAYSGARDEVRTMLAQTPAVRITEGGPGFFRDGARQAPHNLYIRPPELLEGAVEAGAEPLSDVGWVFDAEPPAGELGCDDLPTDDLAGDEPCEDPGTQLDVAMSFAFTTGWSWDEEAGRYRRSQDGEPFEVTGDGRIGAANVVVLATRHYVSEGGYPETDVVTDDARAVVLRDGRRYEARWSKPGPDAPLTLTTVDGEPFPLAPGPTWLHLPEADALPPAPTSAASG